MSLPTDLAADLTNPADEIPDASFATEADPVFDADPLADAMVGAPAAAASGLSVGAWIGIGVAAAAVVGGSIFALTK